MRRRLWLPALASGMLAAAFLHASAAPTAPAQPPADAPAAEPGESTAEPGEAASESGESAAEPGEAAGEQDPDAGPAAGHSYHGEAFDEGPRQAATLLPGMSNVVFESSATEPTTQAFINQGVALLHGFAYLEAERSFRQALQLQPDLAIAYWGMAMANVNNGDRAADLIAEAVQRKDRASQRERLFIEAADHWLGSAAREKESQEKDQEKKKQLQSRREQRYIADLEKILHVFPDDVEAKALLALQLWQAHRKGVPLTSYYAVDALLDEVFAANPMHPAHHYRIHLWDSQRAENALRSAALCGPSMPGVAHMWHMPGHIYSRLHRYADAAWQQEASARVDHAHITRTRILPDQIHNFAHNNEWLTRNLLHLGRVADAVQQARNLVRMPQHPKYNSPQKRGSFQFGRQRLLQALTEFALWDQLIAEAQGPYLAETDDPEARNERLAWLAVAHYQTGRAGQAKRLVRQLRQQRSVAAEAATGETAEAATGETADAADVEAGKAEAGGDAKGRQQDDDQLDQWLATCAAAAAAVDGRVQAFQRHLKQAGKLDAVLQAQWWAQAGDLEKAIAVAEKAVQAKPGQVRPLAVWVDLLWQSGQPKHRKAALVQFQRLRRLAADADLNLPMMTRLAPVAAAAGIEGDWRIPYQPPADLGPRPPLDSLGPFAWQPYQAPAWTAVNAAGHSVDSDAYRGRPTVVIFYLGFGCLHCVEQLHAFQPLLDDFHAAGIDVLAISTESLDQLRLGIKNFDGTLDMPLLADPDLKASKDFRCYDDFEQQPLHGTFLIDAAGLVRWQDISFEPFSDADFLLREARRLLALEP